MSKTKVPAEAVKHSNSKPSARKSLITHLQKIASGKKGAIKIIALIFVFGALTVITFGATPSLAMLYLFGLDGKLSGRNDAFVFQRNGRLRKWVYPALVQNGYTTAIKALLSSLSSGWEALSDSERLGWLNMTWLIRSNRMGLPVTIKGKSAYVALNSNLIAVGATPITDAPADSGGVPQISDLGPVILDQSATTMTVDFFPTPTDAGVSYLVLATKVLPAGISRPRISDFRVIDVILGGTVSPADLQAAYDTKFGTSWSSNAGNQGKKIFFKFKAINIETGADGADIVTSGTIVA